MANIDAFKLLGSLLNSGSRSGGGGGLGGLLGMAMKQFSAAQQGDPGRARAEIQGQLPLDCNPAAHYLHCIAEALGVSPDVANQIHDKRGAPKLYS